MKVLLLIPLLLLSSIAYGQSKLDLTLKKKVRQYGTTIGNKEASEAKGKADGMKQMVNVTAVLVEGASVPLTRLSELGVKVGKPSYGIVELLVPVGSLMALDSIAEFKGYESLTEVHATNVTSRKVEHVDEIQDDALAYKEGLPQTYSGEGVIVGVFDGGIDFNHASFRNPDTKKTRIKKAMVFRNFSIKDGSFVDNDGKEIEVSYIMEDYSTEECIDTLTTDKTTGSHGTHTSNYQELRIIYLPQIRNLMTKSKKSIRS